MTEGIKVCRRCGKEKPHAHFSRRVKDGGLQSWCKTCDAAYAREYRRRLDKNNQKVSLRARVKRWDAAARWAMQPMGAGQ